MAMQGAGTHYSSGARQERDGKDYAPAHSTTVRCEFSQAHASRCKVQCIQLALQWYSFTALYGRIAVCSAGTSGLRVVPVQISRTPGERGQVRRRRLSRTLPMAAEGAVSPAPSRRSPYYMYMYIAELFPVACSCTEKIFP